MTSRAAQAAPRYGHDTRLFVVTMTGAGGQTHGRLQIYGNSGAAFARDVTGATCSEVASALALVTALAIDPQSFTAASASSSTAAVSPSTAALPAGPLPSASSIEPAVPYPTHPAQSSMPGPRTVSTEQHFTPGKPVTWVWSAGMQETAMFHVVPRPAFGGGYFGNLEPKGSWTIWPDFRLAATYVTTVHDTWNRSAGVAARWWWLLARADACPFRLSTADTRLILRTCGGIDGGIITASGQSALTPKTVTRGWSAVGPALRLTWQTILGLNFELGGGLSFPLTRWKFEYNGNDTEFTRVLNWGWTLGGSISYRWQ